MPSPIVGMVGGSLVSGLLGARSADRAADAQADAARDANQTQRYIFDRSVELTEPNRVAGQNALAAMQYEMGLAERPMVGGVAPEITTRTVDIPGTATGPLAGLPPQVAQLFANTPGAQQAAATTGGGQRTEYLVNGQVFGSLDEAQNYANANRTGGTPFQGFQETPGYQYRLDQGQNALARMAGARGMRLSGNTLMDAMRHGEGMAAQEYGDYYNRLAGIAGVGQTATSQQIGAGQNYANAAGQNYMAAGNARASGYMGQNNALQGMFGNFANIYGMHQAGMFGGGGNQFAANPLSGGGLY